MPDGSACGAGRGSAPSHRPADAEIRCRCAAPTVSTPWRAVGSATVAARVASALRSDEPARRTVCLIGDGSAMYSIQALWTAAQRQLPLTVVVLNNSGYGAMRSFSQVMQVRNVPGLDLPGIDFVKLAEGLGCDAMRVSRAPQTSLRRWRAGFGHAGRQSGRGDGGFSRADSLRAKSTDAKPAEVSLPSTLAASPGSSPCRRSSGRNCRAWRACSPRDLRVRQNQKTAPARCPAVRIPRPPPG
jgi:hypothetical protein